MQVFFIPVWQMLVLIFLLWTVIQLGAAAICRSMSDETLLRLRKALGPKPFEWDGRFYRQVLFIHKWKKFLPDGAAIDKSGFRKDRLAGAETDYLRRFYIETYRAELTHILCLPFFWVFGLFAPPVVILLMLLYAIVANVPCIVAQRYNRVRLERVLGMRDFLKND